MLFDIIIKLGKIANCSSLCCLTIFAVNVKDRLRKERRLRELNKPLSRQLEQLMETIIVLWSRKLTFHQLSCEFLWYSSRITEQNQQWNNLEISQLIPGLGHRETCRNLRNAPQVTEPTITCQPYHFPLQKLYPRLHSFRFFPNSSFCLDENVKKNWEFPLEEVVEEAIQPFMLIFIANCFKHVITMERKWNFFRVFLASRWPFTFRSPVHARQSSTQKRFFN